MKNSHYLARMLFILSTLCLLPGPARAGTDLWTGGGGAKNLLWLNAANWTSLPQAGDELVFSNTASLINSNNYPSATLFSGITFASPAGAFVLNPVKTNSSVTLTNNITDNQVVTPETINLPLILTPPNNTLNIAVTPNGILNLNNVISGTGNLVNSGLGTVNLNGSNTLNGLLVINAGTVQISQETNLPAPPSSPAASITINEGTLQALTNFALNPNREIALGQPALAQTSQGAISVNNMSLIPNPNVILTNDCVMGNNSLGFGGLTKLGFGNLILGAQNMYSGTTSNEVGTLTLDFTQAGAPQNDIISESSPFVFGGANAGAGVTNFSQLVINGSASQSDSETFASTHFTVGNGTVRVNNGTGQSVTLNLKALDHDVGGYANFVLPVPGSIMTTTPNTHGILGGWATTASGTVTTGWNVATNWACNDGSGNIVGFTGFMVYSYTDGYVKNDLGADTNLDIPASVAGTTVVITNDIDGAGSVENVNTITVDGGVANFGFLIGSNNTVRLGQFGGVFNRSTGAGAAWNLGGASANQTLQSPVVTNQMGAGFLTAGGPNDNTPGEIMFVSTTTGSSSGQNYDVDAKIVDNGSGAVTVVQSGSGYVKYRNHNSYSGGTFMLGGRTQMVGTDIGTANYGDALGTGPIHIFPGSYLYLGTASTNGTILTNDLFIAGLGTVQEADSAIRASAGNTIASKIVLMGDSGIGGGSTNSTALVTGPVSGSFNMYWGNEGNVGGGGTGLVLSNQCAYTGNTYMMGRVGTAASATRIALGENNALPSGFGFGSLYIGISGDNGNNLAFDLNGYNQLLNGLNSGSAGDQSHDIVCNSSNATTSTLTFGNNDASGLWGGVIRDNSFFPTTATGPTTAKVAITKIGAGVETFTNVNTYSGATTISNGVLALGGLAGSIANSTQVNVNGGTFDVSALSSYVIPSSQTINVNSGTFLVNSASGTATVNFTNGTLELGQQLSGTALSVSTLSLGGSVNMVEALNLPPIGAFPTAPYPIITYSTQTGSASLAATLPAGYGGYVTNISALSEIALVLTNGPVTPFLTWLGTVNNNWDFFTSDWTNTVTHVVGAYSDGSLVTFSDIGHTGIINLTTTYMPAGTTVENTNLNYTFIGTGAIMTNLLTKIGPGTLILDNSGGDTYQGLTIAGGTVQVGMNDTNGSLGDPTKNIGDNGLLVLYRTNSLLVVTNAITGSGAISDIGANTLELVGGNTFGGILGVTPGAILQAGNSTALGSTNSPAYITNGASLDVNGFALSPKMIVTQGGGATNPADGGFDGAIYSSAASSAGPPSVGGVTLLGNVVFGCPTNNLVVPDVQSNRWDIRGTGATLSTVPTGSAYNITKIGANQVSLSGVIVDSGLGNIDVQGGMLSIETTTTGLGNPANTLTVENGATLNAYDATNQFHKNIILNGNALYNHSLGSLNAWSGNDTIVGPLTLNSTVHVSFRTSAGAQNGATLVLSNTVTPMAGAGTLIKEDTNTLTVVGLDNHSGGTLVNDGTFILNGINSNTANTLMVNSHGLTIPAILGGNGTNSGMVTINDTLWPGVGGTPSTFGTKFLSFNGALNAYFSLGSQATAGSGVNDLLNVGVFDPQGSVVFINPIGPLATGNTYTLVNYTSTTGSTFNNSPEVIPADEPSRYVFGVQQTGGNGPGHVTLTVTTGEGVLRWTGIANDMTAVSNVWDLEDVQTWTNTATTSPQSPQDYQFEQGDAVLFDDSIFGTIGTNVVVIETNNPNGTGPSPVMPSSITVSNSVVTNYTFTSAGGGSIGGTTTLTKSGTGVLEISAANTFSGTVTINGGILNVNNTAALGSVNNTIIITNGGTLDVGGPSLSAGQNPLINSNYTVVVSGSGAGGNGAIINSSATEQEYAFENLTLAANTTIGGLEPGRWDVGRPEIGDGVLSTGGHAYNLTKGGTNYVAFLGVTMDTNLANIDIQGGTLGFQQGQNNLGNAASTLTVEAGATLEFYNSTTNLQNLNKQFVLNGDGVTANITNENGTTTLNGSMTLNGSCVIGANGTAITNNCLMSGAGSLTKSAGAALVLTTNETYTGNTTVIAGTLTLAGTASISNSPNLNLAGGTVDVSGRVDGTLTLNGANNQVLIAANTNPTNAATTISTINGNLTNGVNCTVTLAPGATNFVILTVNSNATLSGTTALKLSQGGATNDVLSVGGNLAYGGTLNLTNLTGALASGQTYKVFNASTYNGTSAFASIVPVNPNSDPTLSWDTSQLTINGTIGIMSASAGPGTFTNPPGQLKITLNGANVSITGTNGQSGDGYYLLMSTNVALPKNLWQTVATNVLSADGNFTFIGTNVVTAGGQQQFYLLSNTNAVH